MEHLTGQYSEKKDMKLLPSLCAVLFFTLLLVNGMQEGMKRKRSLGKIMMIRNSPKLSTEKRTADLLSKIRNRKVWKYLSRTEKRAENNWKIWKYLKNHITEMKRELFGKRHLTRSS